MGTEGLESHAGKRATSAVIAAAVINHGNRSRAREGRCVWNRGRGDAGVIHHETRDAQIGNPCLAVLFEAAPNDRSHVWRNVGRKRCPVRFAA